MPPGGDGFYYFSMYFRMYGGISSGFNIEINGELICTAGPDLIESSSNDRHLLSCSGVVYAREGIYKHVYIF